MTGLLCKEFYTLKRYALSYGAALLMFLFISVYMGSASYLQNMMTMSLGMLAFTGITYDKMYGWDKLVLTMPVSRGQIVLSKYIASVVMAVAALILSTGIGIVIAQVFPMGDEPVIEMSVTAIVLLGVLLFDYAVILPLIYKMGVERGRIFMIIVVMAPVLFLTSMAEYIPESFIEYVESHIVLCGVIFVGTVCICYIISYFISVGIYNKKEY